MSFLFLPSHSSWKTSFLESVFPRERYARILLGLVIIKALGYWGVSFWQHANEPLSVIAMFRVGDIQYYPLISACSQCQFGEHALYERLGEGIAYFPCLSVAVYALGLRVFGPAGFIVADVIMTLSYYVIFVGLLRAFGVVRIWAECISLLVVSEAIVPLGDGLRAFYRTHQMFRIVWLTVLGLSLMLLSMVVLIVWSRIFSDTPKSLIQVGLVCMGIILLLSPGSIGTPTLWGWRIFRPFISETVALLCLYCLYQIMHIQQDVLLSRKSLWLWIAGGVCFAVVFQSDIYSAAIMGISLFLGMLYCLWTRSEIRAIWPHYLKGGGLLLSVAIVGSSPFLVQYWFAHSDAARRFGIFPIDRTALVWLPGKAHYAVFAGLCLCGFLLITLSHQSVQTGNQPLCQDGFVLLIMLCFAALIALPVSGIILGKGIQLYHFADRFRKYVMYTTVIMVCHLCAHITNYFTSNSRLSQQTRHRSPTGSMIVIGVMILSLLSSLGYAIERSQKQTHMRSELEEYGSLSDYRADFLGVVNELERQRQAGASVIGTFDHQLYCWWITFANGYAFVPDPLFFTASDRELESRLEVLCALLGMRPDQFHAFIMRPYVNHFWLAHNKYKVSRLYSFAPRTDYEPEQFHRAIEKAGILGGLFAVPLSEQTRLMSDYAALGDFPDDMTLDLLVLTNDSFLMRFQPPDDLFEMIYTNSTFRVWKHIPHETR